jgi:hypothetical protein
MNLLIVRTIVVSEVVAEEGGQAFHPFGGGEGDYVDPGGHVGRSGVDVIDRGAGAHAVEEAGGGIHVERGADYHKDVGFGHQLGGGGDVGHRFLEEYDVGAHPVAVDNHGSFI